MRVLQSLENVESVTELRDNSINNSIAGFEIMLFLVRVLYTYVVLRYYVHSKIGSIWLRHFE